MVTMAIESSVEIALNQLEEYAFWLGGPATLPTVLAHSIEIEEKETTLAEVMREIRIAGVLDSNTAELRGDDLRDLMIDEDGTVLLDLSELHFLSREGVRLFLQIASDLRKTGGEFHVAAPNASVMAALTDNRASLPFLVHETVDEARNSLLEAAMYDWLAEAVI